MKYTPYVEPDLLKIEDFKTGDTKFISGIWKSYNYPEEKYEFPLRARITLFGLNDGPKITMKAALKIYYQLIICVTRVEEVKKNT